MPLTALRNSKHIRRVTSSHFKQPPFLYHRHLTHTLMRCWKQLGDVDDCMGCYTSPSTLMWCLAECSDSACHVILEKYPCWWVVQLCVWVSGDLERHRSETLTLSLGDSDGTLRFLLILNSLTSK